ncbi:hypothetical protein FGO68_gene6321 [Halteria grandinella]|uniref:Uncharacterized protein n=1 Tax=Halteria grandinella TaxID=5974 RepID=A0A8J8NFS6_HALGN|nr:hypothetical protein FGO68_gene6321 [Halteria grandinella]
MDLKPSTSKIRLKHILFALSLFLTLSSQAAITPSIKYDFTQLKSAGTIGDQMNLGITDNDITFQATERLTGWGLPMTGSQAEQANHKWMVLLLQRFQLYCLLQARQLWQH